MRNVVTALGMYLLPGVGSEDAMSTLRTTVYQPSNIWSVTGCFSSYVLKTLYQPVQPRTMSDDYTARIGSSSTYVLTLEAGSKLLCLESLNPQFLLLQFFSSTDCPPLSVAGQHAAKVCAKSRALSVGEQLDDSNTARPIRPVKH
jgi:hypothetical protein